MIHPVPRSIPFPAQPSVKALHYAGTTWDDFDSHSFVAFVPVGPLRGLPASYSAGFQPLRDIAFATWNSEIARLLAAPVPDATMVEFARADIEKSHVGTHIADGVRLRIAERAQPPAATQPSLLPLRTRPRRRKPALRALAWAAVFLILAALAGIYLSEGWRPAGKIEVAAVQGEVYFIAPFVDSLSGLGAIGAGAHAAGESVDLESIPKQAKRAALLIRALARQ